MGGSKSRRVRTHCPASTTERRIPFRPRSTGHPFAAGTPCSRPPAASISPIRCTVAGAVRAGSRPTRPSRARGCAGRPGSAGWRDLRRRRRAGRTPARSPRRGSSGLAPSSPGPQSRRIGRPIGVREGGDQDAARFQIPPATARQAVQTRWSARRRAPAGSRLPPRPRIRRAESARQREP